MSPAIWSVWSARPTVICHVHNPDYGTKYGMSFIDSDGWSRTEDMVSFGSLSGIGWELGNRW